MTDLNLVDKIAQFIERFVFIKDRRIYRLLALWIIQTYMYKDFRVHRLCVRAFPGSGECANT